MKKVILTGATGFVGNAVLRELIKNNIYVIAISRSGNPKNIPDSDLVRYISCDLSEMNSLVNKISDKDIDTFYHFAWNGSAGPARADTNLQLKNAQWTIDSLNVAKKLGCNRFVAAGSIMEHETIAAAYTQGNKPGLGYIYGSGKLVAHTMAMSVAASIGIDLIWAEITNAYGIGELSARMVNTTLRKIIHGENPQFTAGTQNYDFVYIDDVARAFYLIGKNGKPFNDYLIGSSTARPLKEFLLEMKNSVAPNLDFIFGDVPFTGVDLPLEKYDCKKTEEDTGFKASISFAEGTKRTIEWLKEVEKND
ncbi:NAD-dependent epimerase/dehydratase family protein [Megamonas hypermegale]|uniref:NAD-dependent epimerase/dehydratase family protein n=1 Tax=Megamonas hypermegale TaxID=158847 RepID=UPI0026EA00D6|nr:NAD-dependent epimerase/dehydratase family protein [Megamonas hypermegale]